MTNIVIHYVSPLNDPLKIPRPSFVDLETREVTGGEFGQGLKIMGFAPTSDGPLGMIFWDQIDTSALDQYSGWFAVFLDEGSICSIDLPIKKVEQIEKEVSVG